VRVVAVAKDVRITSRKARVVARSVVGLPVAEALTLLSFTPRHGAREVAKVIKSAVANAEHNYNLESSELRVDRIEVDQAGIIKRYIAKPRGMAGSLFKRMSHLRCYVTDEEPEPERRRRSLVAMPGRAASTSARPAATRRRRPAQVRRAQEAAAKAEAGEAAADAGEAGARPATSEELEAAWGEGPEDAGAVTEEPEAAGVEAEGTDSVAGAEGAAAAEEGAEPEAEGEPEPGGADADREEEPENI
jgi:large subunit ribosomal protein L22